MTDEQRVRLIREVLVQVMTDLLSEYDAVVAIALVLDPGPLSYEQVALQIRCKVAHLGD
jgi:hypothetical protein